MTEKEDDADRKLVIEQLAKDADGYRTSQEQRLGFQQEIGLATIKSMGFINAGAIVSLLTFIGNSHGQYDNGDLRLAFGSFAVGLTLTLLTYFAAYLSQGVLMDHDVSQTANLVAHMRQVQPAYVGDANKEGKIGSGLIWAAIGMLLSSLILFVAGSFFALNGILPSRPEFIRKPPGAARANVEQKATNTAKITTVGQ